MSWRTLSTHSRACRFSSTPIPNSRRTHKCPTSPSTKLSTTSCSLACDPLTTACCMHRADLQHHRHHQRHHLPHHCQPYRHRYRHHHHHRHWKRRVHPTPWPWQAVIACPIASVTVTSAVYCRKMCGCLCVPAQTWRPSELGIIVLFSAFQAREKKKESDYNFCTFCI